MESLKQTTKENPKKTWAVVITSIIAVLTLFLDRAEVLGVDTQVIGWVSFAVAAITTVYTIIKSNLEEATK